MVAATHPQKTVCRSVALEVLFEFPLYIYRQSATLLTQANIEADEKKEASSGDSPKRHGESDVPIRRSAGNRRQAQLLYSHRCHQLSERSVSKEVRAGCISLQRRMPGKSSGQFTRHMAASHGPSPSRSGTRCDEAPRSLLFASAQEVGSLP